MLILLFLLFYISIVTSFFNSVDQEEALRKLILKTPILLFPLALLSIKQVSSKAIFFLGLIINYALFLPAVVSVYNYLSNKALFDDLILQSKSLPIEFGYGILHINFSILMACAILFGTFILYNSYKNRPSGILFYTLVTLVVLNFIFIHVLSTRTGLVALYAGLAVFCIYLFSLLPFRKSKWIFLAIIVIPVSLFLVSTSLQNRLKNTVEDFKVVLHQQNANDYSFAMRVKAWQNAMVIIKTNKLRGVGIGDAEAVLYDNFATFDKSILPENRKNPHFQFLETAVQSGLISAILFLFIFLTGFVRIKHQLNYSLIAFLSLLYLASCFESILESQVSVILFVIFIALGAIMQTDTKKSYLT